MLTAFRYTDLTAAQLDRLCTRNTDPANDIRERVTEIIRQVAHRGDAALLEYAQRFDGVSGGNLQVGAEELRLLSQQIPVHEQEALQLAAQNIERFHRSQLHPEPPVETVPGVRCWREIRPVKRVGLYVPGGSAVLPSTFLMLAIPAKIAGCSELVVCSPPQRDGKVNAYLAYCAVLLGIDTIYLAGGAQAVAAMAYGTESIPKVDKIFGPGNQYVTMAKSIIQSTTSTAIDMPAGPSEVLIIADDTADPAFAAADLLAQAEHGPDSQAVLVSTSADLLARVNTELEKQLARLPRAEIAARALQHSFSVLTESLDQAMTFSNRYAPEHLLLQTADPIALSREIESAGSVFIGHLTPESAGDYASGTNHTLPTSGYAHSYSGVSVDSFVKKITFQQISAEGLAQLGPAVEVLAGIEGLDGHARAVTVRYPPAPTTH